MTYTYAIMEVSKSTLDEVKGKLEAADYHHAIHDDTADRTVLDMHGIALRAESKKRWVLGFCFSHNRSHLLLLVKTHPKYLAGKLNGVGGNIERGETPLQAMEREFKEETGLTNATWHHFASMDTERGVMELFVGEHPNINAYRNLTDEVIAVIPTVNVMFPPDESVWMPNLRWLVNMAIARLLGRDSCKHFTIKETA